MISSAGLALAKCGVRSLKSDAALAILAAAGAGAAGARCGAAVIPVILEEPSRSGARRDAEKRAAKGNGKEPEEVEGAARLPTSEELDDDSIDHWKPDANALVETQQEDE